MDAFIHITFISGLEIDTTDIEIDSTDDRNILNECQEKLNRLDKAKQRKIECMEKKVNFTKESLGRLRREKAKTKQLQFQTIQRLQQSQDQVETTSPKIGNNQLGKYYLASLHIYVLHNS